MQFADVGGITLHYAREGVAFGIPLVFINSLGTGLRIWDDVAARFASQHPIIRYDKRGHGMSDCPAAPYVMRDHSADLYGLLETLEVEEEVILVGLSVGGMIALDFASVYAHKVKALILCDTGAKIGNDDMWNERITALRANGMHSMGEEILTRWFSSAFIEQRRAECRGYYNMLTRTPLAGYTGTCEALRDADLRDQLHKIKVNTLVLCGAEDRATPPEQARALAEALPNARVEVIDNAAHLICVEQPRTMAGLMADFLRENSYG